MVIQEDEAGVESGRTEPRKGEEQGQTKHVHTSIFHKLESWFF